MLKNSVAAWLSVLLIGLVLVSGWMYSSKMCSPLAWLRERSCKATAGAWAHEPWHITSTLHFSPILTSSPCSLTFFPSGTSLPSPSFRQVLWEGTYIKLYWMTSLSVVLAEENAVTGRVAAAHLLFKLSVLKDRQDGVKCLFLLYFVHDF